MRGVVAPAIAPMLALAVAGLVAGCGGSGPLLSANANASCLSPVAEWEDAPVARDVRLIRVSPTRARFQACLASNRTETLDYVQVDVQFLPPDQSLKCHENGHDLACHATGIRYHVEPNRTPMPLMPRTVVLISGETDLPANFGPTFAKRTFATVTSSVCTGLPCVPGPVETTEQAVTAIVAEP